MDDIKRYTPTIYSDSNCDMFPGVKAFKHGNLVKYSDHKAVVDSLKCCGTCGYDKNELIDDPCRLCSYHPLATCDVLLIDNWIAKGIKWMKCINCVKKDTCYYHNVNDLDECHKGIPIEPIKEVCEWKRADLPENALFKDVAFISCKGKSHLGNVMDWKVCPYCIKPIKIKGE